MNQTEWWKGTLQKLLLSRADCWRKSKFIKVTTTTFKEDCLDGEVHVSDRGNTGNFEVG